MTVQMLRTVSEDVQKFLDRKGKIKVVPASKGGHNSAPVDPEFREIFGAALFCEGGPIRGSFNGRDHVRQGSQKKIWTRKVRGNMEDALHHREIKQMSRDGKVGVGKGTIEVPKLRTGTEG